MNRHQANRSSAEAMHRLTSGETVRNFQNRYRHQDGSYRWLSWNSFPDSARGQILAVARDVTERRSLERQLYEAQKMESMGRLTGGIAHDFNNILTGIRGFSDLALEALEEDSPPFQDVLEISEQHGGEIEVQSEPGIGTSFSVYLPCVDQEEEPAEEAYRRLG